MSKTWPILVCWKRQMAYFMCLSTTHLSKVLCYSLHQVMIWINWIVMLDVLIIRFTKKRFEHNHQVEYHLAGMTTNLDAFLIGKYTYISLHHTWLHSMCHISCQLFYQSHPVPFLSKLSTCPLQWTWYPSQGEHFVPTHRCSWSSMWSTAKSLHPLQALSTSLLYQASQVKYEPHSFKIHLILSSDMLGSISAL